MSGETHQIQVGRFTCTVINDGHALFPVAAFFGHLPHDELHPVLAEWGIHPDAFPVDLNVVHIASDGQQILLDTGLGRDIGGEEGRLRETLRTMGVAPEDIDLVVLTHGHWDHIGGVTFFEGQVAFPNARFLMPAVEWAHWTNPANHVGMDVKYVAWIKATLPFIQDRVELIAPDAVIVPGVQAIPAPGHTQGHIAVSIRSEDREAIYLADAAHHFMQVSHPNWSAEVDTDRDLSQQTRRALLRRAAESGATLIGCHFPFPGAGTVTAAGSAWRWHA